MTPQQYERLTELFQTVMEMAPDERKNFLGQLSDSDGDLRRELESLLVAQGTALTEPPPDDIAAGYLAQQGDSPAFVPALAPNTRLDRYEIRSLLGKGGMGEVYLAEDLRLHRSLALKILTVGVAASDDRLRRFEQEAQAAAALNHPNIAHIYEIGNADGVNFIAMEFIDGATLRAKIHNDRTDLPKLLRYLGHVAEGLAKAHSAGIVHRDLKPDNIMITRDDYAKILDFGLAKLIEPQGLLGLGGGDPSSEIARTLGAQHSLSGTIMGTAGYMSPEQAQGRVEQIDHRSDIFAFGCILFEAVTRHRPFADVSLIKSLHKVTYEDAPPLKDFNPSAPPELQRIVHRCLAKDREQRYQTSRDLAIELKEVEKWMAGSAERGSTSPALNSHVALRRKITESSATSTASARYIATELKRYRKGITIIVAALVLAFAYGLYRFSNQKRPTAPSPAIKMTRLTATGKVLTGSISPDGKQVVYVVGDAGRQSIWVRQVATSGSVQIVLPAAATYANISFTHDGSHIYFNKQERDEPGSLYQMSSFGGVARKIIDNVTSNAVRSSDEKRIAFIRGGPFEKENSLVLANNDGSGEQVLATRKGLDNFYYEGIAWSPDGKSITCVAGEHAGKLIEVPLNGDPEKLIKTPKWFAIIDFEWLPDRSGLMVAALEQSRASPLQIWHLSYPSGDARRVTNDFSNYTNLSLSADASALVAIKREPNSHIWTAPVVAMSDVHQITTGTGRQDGNPSISWTPDGKIVYDSTASGNIHTWIMNADGSNQRQLTEGGFDDQGAKVSPDGRYILFTSNRSGSFHIYRMDLDGNNLKQITNGTREVAPFFSPDGRWVICNSGTNASWKVPADGGNLIPLTKDSWASGISPDGRLAAYVQPVRAGSSFWNIVIRPFEGGPPLKTFGVRSDLRPNLLWKPDSRAFIYNLTLGGILSGVTNLWIQPLNGGPPKQLTDFKSDSFFSFAWSRDGEWVAYGRGTPNSDVVLIRDFR